MSRRMLTVMAVAAAIGCLSATHGLAQPRTSVRAAKQDDNAKTCDRTGFRVALDVGHTPEDPGAISARGKTEYEYNLSLAGETEKALKAEGFAGTILLLTSGTAQAGLAQRVTAANRTEADLLISLHHDSVPDKFLETWDDNGTERRFSDRFRGYSLFVSVENPKLSYSMRFARFLGQQLKARDLQYAAQYTESFMGHRQRELLDKEVGIYRFDQLYVLRATQMPAVLLEAGSIINRDEELLMGTPERKALIAAAIVKAVETFCASLPRPAKAPVDARKPNGTAVSQPTPKGPAQP